MGGEGEPDHDRGARSGAAGWLTAATVTAVVAVNAAGLWGIAAARRGVRDEAVRLFRAQTEARARAIESRVSATRTDLSFLAGSSAVSRMGTVAPGRGEADWSRRAAEAALLVFLRGHPEVKHLALMAGRDQSLVEAGRRGGVPVLWRTPSGVAQAAEPALDRAAEQPTAQQPAAEPTADERRLRAVLAHEASGSAVAPRVVVELDARALLGEGEGGSPSCSLRDAAGQGLTAPSGATRPLPTDAGPRLSAQANVRAEGWSAPSPWALNCQGAFGLDASLEPVAARGRVALGLNLVVMTLAVLLGFVAVQQARRRARLEAEAREKQRVQGLERQLFHAERLGTVGRLAAGLAHELNNPLEGMANYLGVARAHLAKDDVDAVRRDLDLVRQGLDRAAGIVRQVLEQSTPAEAPAGPVELRAVLRQTVEFVRSREELRGIRFRLEIDDDPLLVRGRPVGLGQVLLNLLTNACEAQPAGGEVAVRAARQDTEARIEIADRGPGVPLADRARVFEPFYSTKSSTGLGLSVCQAIVRQHHGRLELRDREGGGALFALFLPLEEGARERSA